MYFATDATFVMPIEKGGSAEVIERLDRARLSWKPFVFDELAHSAIQQESCLALSSLSVLWKTLDCLRAINGQLFGTVVQNVTSNIFF